MGLFGFGKSTEAEQRQQQQAERRREELVKRTQTTVKNDRAERGRKGGK